MRKEALVRSWRALLCAWLPIACGDTQGNVIERTATVTDGGGGSASDQQSDQGREQSKTAHGSSWWGIEPRDPTAVDAI